MRDPQAFDAQHFDALYAETRSRLLVQTFALVGDLDRARATVEEAFVQAWHHWPRVAAAPDREAWVRRVAWRRLSRRSGRRGRRQAEDLGPEVAGTLAALAALPARRRQILVLDQSTGLSIPQIAREVGVSPSQAQTELAAAVAAVRSATNSGESDRDPSLEERRVAFARTVAGAPWTLASRLRRAGGARRRSHTLLGILATTMALIGSGIAVTQPRGARPTLAAEELTTGVRAVQISPPAPPPARLLPGDMLTADQVSRLDRSASWTASAPPAPVAGRGPVLPCQQAGAAATPAPTPAVEILARRFTGARAAAAAGSGPDAAAGAGPDAATGSGSDLEAVGSAVQVTELARTRRAARTAYRRQLGWYSACADPRVQLLSTRVVDGVGTAAALFVLRSWSPPVTTLTVALARTGRMVTTVARLVPDEAPATLPQMASLLAAAVNGLCGSPGVARCASPPALVQTPPLPVGPVPGMLAVVDLPPVADVQAPWVATVPERAAVNVAATGCDGTVFTERPMTRARTRSFLVTEDDLPDEFGLTQTVGVLPDSEQAAAFVQQVRDRLAVCEEGDLGTEVEPLAPGTGAPLVAPDPSEAPATDDDTGDPAPESADPSEDADPTDPADQSGAPDDGAEPAPAVPPDDGRAPSSVALWQVTTEISDERSVRFLMAIVRSGGVVSQIGFVPVAGADMGTAAFARLVDRAVQRLPSYAAPRRAPR